MRPAPSFACLALAVVVAAPGVARAQDACARACRHMNVVSEREFKKELAPKLSKAERERMMLALVLNQQFFGRSVVRVIFLMPMMTLPVVVGYTGRMFFDSMRSPIADLWRHVVVWWADMPLVGSQLDPTLPWLTHSSWARASIVLMDSWQWIPFVTLILLAGMQAIPDDIYEAARVDGASSFQMFWRITFPILLPLSVTVTLIRGLEIFKIIDVIVVTTGGGPGSATESLTMYVYKTALSFGNYGYAAAISFVLLALVILFATVFLGLARRAVPHGMY